ncbi:conserved hypothetical protein [Streptomyces sp. Mg1]|nr:conserved hypothetical protein [Streptomyces sp. Mg1]RPK44218.1 hypothetical protein EES37_16720 [Streptomyces sp. ADI91-18]WSX95808.1 transposase [Streptomyces goshikiensis]
MNRAPEAPVTGSWELQLTAELDDGGEQVSVVAACDARRDELFELVDAVLCADGAVRSPVDLRLLPEHRGGHGAMYGGLNHGRIDVDQLRTPQAGLPLPRFDGGRLGGTRLGWPAVSP